MRAVLFLAAGLIGLPLAALAQPAAQPDIPVVHYKAVPEWPKAPVGDKGFPSAWNYWQVTSVAVEKNGNILVMHRGDYPILEYKPEWRADRALGRGEVQPRQGHADGAGGPHAHGMSGYQAVYGPAGCSNCGAHEIRVDPDGNVWAGRCARPGHHQDELIRAIS